MKFRSFRLRLALISVTISGVVILAFGLVAWGLLYQNRLETLDEELSRVGYPVAHAMKGRGGTSWERVEGLVTALLGEERLAYWAFSILNDEGKVIHQSENWPKSQSPLHFSPSAELVKPPEQLFLPFRGGPDGERGRFRRSGRPDEPGRGRRMEGEGDRSRRFPPDGGPPPRSQPLLQKATFVTAKSDGESWRIGAFGDDGNKVLVAADLDDFNQDVDQMLMAFAVATVGALTLTAGGGWLLSSRALRPITQLTEATRRVTATGLDQRVELNDADVEFQPLVTVFNEMMNRMEISFRQALRFSADASHELKTPVAIMKGTLERALAESPPHSPEQTTYSLLLEEVEHQQSTLNRLLLLSRADAGQLPLSDSLVNFSELIETGLEDAEMMAEGKGIELQSDLEPDVWVKADSILLQQVIHNLLTNAIKYNVESGWVKCVLTHSEGHVEFAVSNSGRPLPENEWERVFERFYRSAGRDEHVEGVGLGLSLAYEIVKAHQGSLFIRNSDSKGTTFVLQLESATSDESLLDDSARKERQ